jgi:hypothetical protein
MADPSFTPPNAPLTEASFLADRMTFWGRVTGATVKVAAGLFFFCGWLWFCAFNGFTLLHVLALPVVVALLAAFL